MALQLFGQGIGFTPGNVGFIIRDGLAAGAAAAPAADAGVAYFEYLRQRGLTVHAAYGSRRRDEEELVNA